MAHHVAPADSRSDQARSRRECDPRCVVGDHHEWPASGGKDREPKRPQIEAAKLDVKNVGLGDLPAMSRRCRQRNSHGRAIV